jgi:hypothetical protein
MSELKIKIATPCPVRWAEMEGDERDRICQKCNLHVYNTSKMTTAEVEALVEKPDQRVCALVYRRRDGTIITKDCPNGVAELWDRWTTLIVPSFVFILGWLGFSFAQGQLASSISAAFSSVVGQLGQLASSAPYERPGIDINPEEAKISEVCVSHPGYFRPKPVQESQSQLIDQLTKNLNITSIILVNPTRDELIRAASAPNLQHLDLHVRFLDTDTLRGLEGAKNLSELSLWAGYDELHSLPLTLGLSSVENIDLHLIPNWSRDMQPNEQQARNSWHGEWGNALGAVDSDLHLPNAELVPDLDCAAIPADANIRSLLAVCRELKNSSALNRLDRLRLLQLNAHRLSDDDLMHIAQIPTLQEAGLYTDSLSATGLQAMLLIANANLQIMSLYKPSPDVLHILCDWSHARTLVARPLVVGSEASTVTAVKSESIRVVDDIFQNSYLPSILKWCPDLRSIQSPSDDCAYIIRQHWRPKANGSNDLK